MTFRGKGLFVVFLSFLPLLFEAVTQALVSYGLFNLPIEVAFSQGFAISAVATAIVVP